MNHDEMAPVSRIELLGHDIETATLSLVQEQTNYAKTSAFVMMFIDGISEVNHTRLYWLWIKYSMSSIAYEQWKNEKQINSMLTTLGPGTDVLSYGLYVMRIMAHLALICASNSEQPLTKNKIQCLTDLLWALSNGACAFYLNSSSIRPEPYSAGWYGNLSMQLLLGYDVLLVLGRYVTETKEIDSTQILALLEHVHHRNLLATELGYSMVLVLGFAMFRGFFLSSNRLNPCWGSMLCVAATITYERIMWFHLKSHYCNVQKAYAQPSCESTINRFAALSFLIHFLFPALLNTALWISLDTRITLAFIIAGLIMITGLNGYAKYQMQQINSSLIACSLFRMSNQNQIDAPNTMHLDANRIDIELVM